MTIRRRRLPGTDLDLSVISLGTVSVGGIVSEDDSFRLMDAYAEAGVEGIVPVRYWKQTLGHTLVALRTDKGILIMDPLGAGATRPYPKGYPDVITIETGAPSFGSYVTDDIMVLATGRRLTRELPHLQERKGPAK